MENNDSKNWLTIIFIIAFVWAIFFHKDKYEGLTAEDWFYEYDYQIARNEELESRLSEYQDAFQEANDNIEEAKWYAWESYEEMGEALDYLDIVPEPWFH